MKNYTELGKFNGSDLDLIELDGVLIVLDGWNGEKFTECSICKDVYSVDVKEQDFTLVPIYDFEVNGEILDEYGEIINTEIIDFKKRY